MHHLLQQFLSSHHRCMALGSTINISTELDIAVNSFYVKAEMETRRRLRSRKINRVNVNALLTDILACQLTLVLLDIDLNSEKYDQLIKAVKRWHPCQFENKKSCLHFQSVLLQLLPVVRKKQQLLKVTEEYQQYLKNIIEKDLQTNHGKIYRSSFHGNTVWVARPVNSKFSVKPMQDFRSPMERIAENPSGNMIEPNKTLAGAFSKYLAVSSMVKTLKTPVKSAHKQIADFRHEFQLQRKVLEKNRDNAAISFMKAVVTFLTGGVAAYCGIWRVKGKAMVKQMQEVLQAPTSSAISFCK